MANKSVLNDAQLPTKLATFANSSEPIYILFTASKDESGQRWCPDCVAAEPVLEEAEENIPAGSEYMEVEISRQRWKESPGKDHEFRSEPFQVGGIPALVRYNPMEKKVLERLVESECLQLERVASLFRDDEV